MIEFLKKNKNIIFDDLIFLKNNLKLFNFMDYLFLFLILPIVWFLVLIYFFSFIVYFIYYLCYFIFIYFKKYILKKKTIKKLYYKKNKIVNKNDFYIFFKAVFIEIPKQYGFYYLYNFLKTLQIFKKLKENNKQKINFVNFINIFLIIFIKFFIKFFLFFIFSYGLFIIKISLNIIKITKQCISENYNSFYLFLQYWMVDFLHYYLEKSYLNVKSKKIKFFKKQIIFNPPKFEPKKIIALKIKIDESRLDELQKALDKISEHSKIRYVKLKSSEVSPITSPSINDSHAHINESGFDVSPSINSTDDFLKSDFEKSCNKKEIIFEKKPHVSSIFSVDENIQWMNRGTTKKFIETKIKSDLDVIKNESMETHTPYKGSINISKTEYKTNLIQSDKKDIEILPHKKLLQNIYNNPEYKTIYKQALINSLKNPFYIWEKGNLYKDIKYVSLADKILNDPFLNKNNDVMKAMNIVVKIYKDHFQELQEINNTEIFDKILNILLTDQEYIINQNSLNILLDLINNS